MARKNQKRGKSGKSPQNPDFSDPQDRPSFAGVDPGKRWGQPNAQKDAQRGGERGGQRPPSRGPRRDERGSGPEDAGGGFQFKDRSGKVHSISPKNRDSGRGHQPKIPISRIKSAASPRSDGPSRNQNEERVYRPRPESEVVAKPARGRTPPAQSPASGQRNQRSNLIKLKASVDKNRKGFGFLSFENRQYEDAFVPPREAQTLFHGDRVEVTISSEGEVHDIRVLQHRFRELVGRYAPHPAGPTHGGWIVYERKKAREEVFVPDLKGLKPAEGDWMRATLEFHEEGPYAVTAKILEVFGPDLPPSADVSMIANEYNLVEEHPEDSEKEAREKRLEIPGKDLVGRDDLRKVPFITIDGETARDFDDAVYVERAGKGFVLWVAIADVSHYVEPGSALDKDAFSRATSVYFPERAFHMLPRALSENLCSLRPNEPRLTMVARMDYNEQGERTATEMMEAVIESHRRATYTEIQTEWEANGSNRAWEFTPHFDLYKLIRKQRSDRGSIDFDLPESEILVEKTGEVISIKNRARVDAHRLIEEFMISANEAVTEWAMERKWPFVYRVHDVPAMQALEKFQALAANVGVDFDIGDASPKVMAELVKRLAGNPAQELLNMALLRSMKQAAYSAAHGMHFGLASPGYTHFTSPIRRYPDLLVHRILRRALRVEKGIDKPLTESDRKKLEEELAEACEHCSYRERLAGDAERDANKLKQVRLMMKYLGDEFAGKINGMTENGMFVQLDEPFVEGMVHKDTLDDDFYQFDDQHMIFFGKRKRRTFKMGDRVKVRVVRADIDLRVVDFELLEGGVSGRELPANLGQNSGGRDGKRGGQRGGRGGNRDTGRGGGRRDSRGEPGWAPRAGVAPSPSGFKVKANAAGAGRSERFVDEARPRKGKHEGKGKNKGKRRPRK